MNWKKAGVYLWPLLAWPSMVFLMLVTNFPYAGKSFVLEFAPLVLCEIAFPYHTVPVLFLFALSCHWWLRLPNWKTFLGTLLTAWGILGPFGLGAIVMAYWKQARMQHIFPLSTRILIIALIAVSPYILLLYRSVQQYQRR